MFARRSRGILEDHKIERAFYFITIGMVEVFSAGTEPGQVHPMAWIAMAEIGIAIGEQHSKSQDEFIGQRFDYIILPALQAVLADMEQRNLENRYCLRVLLVHGSPRRVNEYLYEDRPDRSLERILDQAEADVLVCGHTHIPYHRILPSGRHVVNAGSVGKPKDGDPRAGYVVLEANGHDLEVRFMRVPYDVEQAAGAIEASKMPDEYAEMLRTGTV